MLAGGDGERERSSARVPGDEGYEVPVSVKKTSSGEEDPLDN